MAGNAEFKIFEIGAFLNTGCPGERDLIVKM